MANEILQQMSAGFEPLAGGQPGVMGPPIPSVPFADQLGPLGPVLTQLMAQQMMSSAGLNPIGAGFGMNPQDALYRHQQYLLQQQLMQSASGLEREQYMRTAQGMATLAGMPFGPSERRAITPYLDMAMQAGPIFAQMNPQLMDQMAGPGGSPMLMSYYMANAAPYRMDPVTGGYGMSGQSMEFYRNRMYNDLIDSPSGVSQRFGVSAGEVGGMYQELSRRGMLPGGDPRADALAALSPTRVSELTGGAGLGGDPRTMSRSQLSGLMENEGLRQEVGDFDAGRIKQSLESYSEVVAAMKDLLGANGEPNAPIQKILRDLDAISQGNTAQMAPGRLAEMVRGTHQLSQMTGMSLDSVMMLQGHAASRLSGAGLEATLAPGLTQGSVAYGGAMRANGITPTYGGMSADERQQLDLNLRVNAADSTMANRLGALMRIRETAGGFSEGSEAERIAQAVLGGDARGAYISDAQFMRAMTGATNVRGERIGMTESDLRGYLGQDFTNREYAQNHDVFNLTREQQALDVQKFAAGRSSQFIESRLRARGVDAARAREIANAQGGAIADSLQELTEAERANAGTRRDVIGRGLGDAFGDISEAERDVLAEELWGNLDRTVRNSGMRGYGSAINMFNSNDPRTMADSRRLRQQAALRGRLQQAMQGMGSDSVIRTAIGAIQNAKPDDNLTTVVGRALGGVGDAELHARIADPLSALSGMEATAEDLLVRISDAASPEERTRLQKEFEEQLAGIEARRTEAGQVAESAGIVLNDTPLGAEQLSQVRQGMTSLTANIGTLASEIGEGKKYKDFAEFWDSDAAGRFGLSVSASQGGLQDVAATALNSPSTMSRLGVGGIEAAREAKSTQRELQTLADHYAAGDVKRLLAGDLNTTDPNVRKRIAGQVGGILRRQDAVMKTFEGKGQSGSDVLRGLAREGLSPKFHSAAAWDKMTPEQRMQAKRVAEMSDAYSSELTRLGRPGADINDLTPEQQARVRELEKTYRDASSALEGATGVSGGQVLSVGRMQGSLDQLREREAAIASGDPTAMLSEFERLSGMDVDESDTALQSAARGGSGWMQDMISSLRTIESIRPEGQSQQGFMKELEGFALETDLTRKKQRLKTLEGMGVTQTQLEQAGAAYTELNDRGYLGIARSKPEGQQSALSRQLAASPDSAGSTQRVAGRLTIVDTDGAEMEADLDAEVIP